MQQIISSTELTQKETEFFLEFLTNKLPTLIKPKDTLMDNLNYQIKFLKGRDILTYYTPCDPTKDKEPLLSYELSQKWLPAKTVAQKDQLVKESETMAKKKLDEGPEEKKKLKIVRVIK